MKCTIHVSGTTKDGLQGKDFPASNRVIAPLKNWSPLLGYVFTTAAIECKVATQNTLSKVARKVNSPPFLTMFLCSFHLW